MSSKLKNASLERSIREMEEQYNWFTDLTDEWALPIANALKVELDKLRSARASLVGKGI